MFVRSLFCLYVVSSFLFVRANHFLHHDRETPEDETIDKREWKSAKGVGKILVTACFEVRPCRHRRTLGSKKNPASSCKAILDHDWSSPNGVYYIKTPPTVTQVYCYMTSLPGCGEGGWTTLLKIDGRKHTFKYSSALWSNKNSYYVTNGQSGADDQETKLPTYWTLPFKSLCLGMKVSGQIKWIHLNYRANSLYSVIADGRYRSFAIGRGQWKSLIAGSSLQAHCNREGFNALNRIRIGYIANQQNDCSSPDSYVAFGAMIRAYCSGRVSTGNCAQSTANDNGRKSTPAFGYVLAQ